MNNDMLGLFASRVFNDTVMREKLPENVYREFRRAVSEGISLDRSLADPIADAMREWAVENGATHYTHWFQPMTGVTAEKHEAFIGPDGNGGALLDFSGKNLIKGEADASAFPSGGLRATFEARGYTAWDPTTYPFIKENTLCIPTAFLSYTGDVLDMKTPLLRSTAHLDQATVRLLRLLSDNETQHVTACVGAEQEYFLIDRELFYRRPDLIYTGRTLFGARPARGSAGTYYGALRERVSAFMADLDRELWKLGIYARTEHAEAAPAQHELAPVFTDVNSATDHNQLTMELLRKVALKHGMECVLHEKPFMGVNGSGKHLNWSLSTDKGDNLLNPGSEPGSNLRFLVFLSAVIRAVDRYGDLLLISVANAANDNRLGGNEAPPALISIYIGDKLESILRHVERHEKEPGDVQDYYDIGLASLPRFRRDTSDRNRTSPFAFTGNKFEFRMPGSSQSIAWPTTVLNAITAESITYFCDEIEKSDDHERAAWHLIRETYRQHGRILFSGNNYSSEWIAEAEKRGLPHFGSSDEALSHLTDEKNIRVFADSGIFTRPEINSRREILLNDYASVLKTEGRTLLDMVRRDILPAVLRYADEIADSLIKYQALKASSSSLTELFEKLTAIEGKLSDGARILDEALTNFPEGEALCLARYARQNIRPVLEQLRGVINEAELITASSCWPYPTYSELLHLKDDGGIS